MRTLYVMLLALVCSQQSTAMPYINASIGVLVRLHAYEDQIMHLGDAYTLVGASAAMAVHHINNRIASLVPNANWLLPAKFKLEIDLQDSLSSPRIGIERAVQWNREGRHVVVGSWRSAVSGPLSLAASITNTPVISWGSTSSTLSDKITYPLLFRTSESDRTLARGVINTIGQVMPNRISIIVVDDAYGRAFAQDVISAAAEHGIEVAASVAFSNGDPASIESAVEKVAVSGSRVILSIQFDEDLPAILDAAEKNQLLGIGFAWVTAGIFSLDAIMASPDQQNKMQQISGWLNFEIDMLYGEKRDRFHRVLRQEPLQHLHDKLIAGELSEELVQGRNCTQYCATIYDAVWAASIAIGRSWDERTGSVDKERLLAELRNVSFEGASGAVRFNPGTGDRDSEQGSLPVLVKNIRPSNLGAGLELALLWRWGNGVLVKESEELPLWPGGGQGWSLPVIPSIAVLVPLHDGGNSAEAVALGDDFVRFAASAMMAASHVNSRDPSLVRGAREILPPNLRIFINLQDTLSDPSTGVARAIESNQQGHHVIIGAYRSAVTGPVSLAASVGKTPVITWASSASSLSNTYTYPLLSRTVVSDAVLAAAMVQSIRAFGWKKISILVVNDAYGRALAQDTTEAATEYGVEVAASVSYEYGDSRASISDATKLIKLSTARVIVCVIFGQDVEYLLDAARSQELLGAGFTWIVAGGSYGLAQLPAGEENPILRDRMIKELSGWLVFENDVLYGERGKKFHSVLRQEPLQHLHDELIAGQLSEGVIQGGSCTQYCATIYDAVWAASIAIGRSWDERTGSVDKERLLAELRNVVFEGASGPVQFDPVTGDREQGSLPVLVKNIRPSESSKGLEEVVTWEWTQGTAEGRSRRKGEGYLKRVTNVSAPYWMGGRNGWIPPLDSSDCDEGFVYLNGKCEACPPGTQQVAMECEPCPAGTFTSQNRTIQCGACQEGYADEPGMEACKPCPENSRRLPASAGVSITECECLQGYFRSDGPGSECFQCITGGVCEGGDAQPYPLPGFWGDEACMSGRKDCPSSRDFFECAPSENCLGGKDFACEQGRTDRLCIETQKGFGSVGGVFWWECGEYGHLWTVLGICGTVAVWFGLNAIVSGKYVALNTALLFVQMTALISSYGLKWHRNLKNLNLAMGVMNFDVDFVSPHCLADWNSVYAFYFQLCLPFVFGAAYAAVFILKALWRHVRDCSIPSGKSRGMLKKQTIKQFISFVLIVYTTLALKVFSTFRCSKFPDGKWYMFFAPSVECWRGPDGSTFFGSHIVMMVIASFYGVVVLMGLPIYLAWIIHTYSHRGTLHTPEVDWQWGFVHTAYESKYKYWECMLILRRFLIAFITAVVEEPMLQGAVSLVILTALLAAQVYAKPFITASIDVLDCVCLCGTMFYVLGGMLMYPSITQQAQGTLCAGSGAPGCEKDEWIKEAISIVCLCSIFLTLATAIWLTYQSVTKHRASQASPKHIRNRHNRHNYTKLKQAFSAKPSSSEAADRDCSTSGLSNEDPFAQTTSNANRVRLDELLDGPQLLKWAKSPAELCDPGSSENYLLLERNIQAVEVILTQASMEQPAPLMRELCEIEGIIDYLAWEEATERGVDGLNHFVQDMALFLRNKCERNFPVHYMINFEHRPIISYWLMGATPENRRVFRQLTKSIQAANQLDLPVWKRAQITVGSIGSAIFFAQSSLRKTDSSKSGRNTAARETSGEDEPRWMGAGVCVPVRGNKEGGIHNEVALGAGSWIEREGSGEVIQIRSMTNIRVCPLMQRESTDVCQSDELDLEGVINPGQGGQLVYARNYMVEVGASSAEIGIC